jgi:hypothetical protein
VTGRRTGFRPKGRGLLPPYPRTGQWVCNLTPQDFCPFAVPAPQFHFVDKAPFAEGESSTWTLAQLKDRLLSIGALYLDYSHEMQAGTWYEQRRAFGTREANLSDFLQTFQAITDSDRFRSLVLARYESDLTFALVNRLIADLVRESGGVITIVGAEKLTLGQVAERLERMNEPRATDAKPAKQAEYKEDVMRDHYPWPEAAEFCQLALRTLPELTFLHSNAGLPTGGEICVPAIVRLATLLPAGIELWLHPQLPFHEPAFRLITQVARQAVKLAGIVAPSATEWVLAYAKDIVSQFGGKNPKDWDDRNRQGIIRHWADTFSRRFVHTGPEEKVTGRFYMVKVGSGHGRPVYQRVIPATLADLRAVEAEVRYELSRLLITDDQDTERRTQVPDERHASSSSPKGNLPPIPLTSWTEIMDTLNEPHGKVVWRNDDSTRDKIRKLNQKFDGPIRFAKGRGRQPEVEKGALVEWFHGLGEHLDARMDETERELDSAQQTTKERYSYGQTARVVPGIGGHEKKSRRKPG